MTAKAWDFPTLEEALAIHEDLIHSFGGSLGVRDMGALESALMRPQLGYYDTLVDAAAAMMESLAQNHPFVDGNKRVAFALTATFLRMNGHALPCAAEETYRFFMTLFEQRRFAFDELRPWLLAHVRPL